MNPLQPQILAKGREIFAHMRGTPPGIFNTRSITGRLMDWSMNNEALKVQLFRFVDVLPSLSSPGEIAEHARDYLMDGETGLPGLARWAIRWSPKFPWLAAVAARRGVERMSRTFIVARNGTEALPVLRQLRDRPVAFTVDILGETAVSAKEAEVYQQRYLELIERLAAEAITWPEVPQIDSDDRGPIPKVNVSVKISALHAQIHPADPEGAIRELSARLLPLLERARELGVFINFDMESTALKDLTIELFKRLLDEPSLRHYPHAGIALQAYLRNSAADLENLLHWAKNRDRRITIRLIKGAYWDTETVLARQRGWSVPVFERKPETDANYERLARVMLENQRWINCAFGTHSVRSIAACLVQAEHLGLHPRSLEIQMLYGMAEPIKAALNQMGYRVREYCPVGEILPGMSYLVRRLLENTSNEGFLRATFSENVSPAELLRDPEELLSSGLQFFRPSRDQEASASGLQDFRGSGGQDVEGGTPTAQPQAPGTEADASWRHSGRDGNDSPRTGPVIPPFANEPPTDFTLTARREEMSRALGEVRLKLGSKYPLCIGGNHIWTSSTIASINPARPEEIVGHIAMATRDEAEAAVVAARQAWLEWRRRSVDERARVLERAADIMRQERFQLAALEVYETGKPWVESDGDVAEAIDFCNFYAQEMRRIASAKYIVPGETSVQHYIPRGIAVVIAPWNFPLAILCGMTTAAMVAGNCVLMKPAEQSSVVAAWFMDILRRAGTPAGVVNFVPGPGREIGAYLVEHPQVDLIAFTGSREVGLKIYEAAGRTRPGQLQLKKVICEMGGKNALIVDNDADLDEAIPAIIASAFGYQGQKCSALSRLIVLAGAYDRLLERLVEAARGVKTGLPEEPATIVGPVIDRAAFERIREYIEIGKTEARLAYQGSVPAGTGFFIPPTIFVDVPPGAKIAREEIFGPVLAVFKAQDLDEALALANDSQYALTGGFFSRSPANIARVSAEMEVGNLYINRGTTGALVARHPFGGFKLSGGGTKAGGRDYLPHFLFPRVVTENRIRRGFAAEEEPGL